jgi:hypothetical protein
MKGGDFMLDLSGVSVPMGDFLAIAGIMIAAFAAYFPIRHMMKILHE